MAKGERLDLVAIADQLVCELSPLRFGPPVTHVYNPLDYAGASYVEYIKRYGSARREVILLGMNPGPWGMAQTGVPFGEVGSVHDWLGIRAEIRKPKCEHPRRPVRGWDCHRSEVSGQRIWGWARDTFGTPGKFFRRFFVANYCPLTFMESSGRNRTPDKLPSAERQPLFDACDWALRRTVEALRPRIVVGVGGFAEGRALAALKGMDIEVGRILHPSPASPAANAGWAEKATAQLADYGLELPRC